MTSPYTYSKPLTVQNSRLCCTDCEMAVSVVIHTIRHSCISAYFAPARLTTIVSYDRIIVGMQILSSQTQLRWLSAILNDQLLMRISVIYSTDNPCFAFECDNPISNMNSRGWNDNIRAKPKCWHFDQGTVYLNIAWTGVFYLFCCMTNYKNLTKEINLKNNRVNNANRLPNYVVRYETTPSVRRCVYQ